MGQTLNSVGICSLALKQLGDAGIASLTANSPAAAFMNDSYAPARDFLLETYPWKFAIKRVALNQLTAVPVTLGSTQGMGGRTDLPNTYAYALPDDYLRDIETGNDPNPYKVEFIVTNATTGAGQVCVISDDNTLVIRYCARVTDTSTFTPAFAWALTAYMAAEAALNITGSLKKQEQLYAIFKQKIQEARTANSFEGSQDTLWTTALTTEVR